MPLAQAIFPASPRPGELSDADLFGQAPVAPPPQAHTLAPKAGELSDADLFGSVPAATPSPAAPAGPAPSFLGRVFSNFQEAAGNGTNQSVLRNEENTMLHNLRQQGQPEAADRYEAARTAREAADKAAYEAMPGWNQGGIIDRAKAGLAALTGQLAGDLTNVVTNPTKVITEVPGLGPLASRLFSPAVDAVAPVAERVVPKVIQKVATSAPVKGIATAGANQAVVATAADPVEQAAKVGSGMQQAYDPLQTALAPVMGFVTGGTLHGLHEAPGLLKGLTDSFRAWRDARGSKVAPDAPPTPDEMAEFKGSPELAAFMQSAGVPHSNLSPDVATAASDRLARRQATESITVHPPQDAGGSKLSVFKNDEERLRAEREGVQAGETNPAAASTAGRVPRADLPPVIPVTPEGQADVGDLGVRAGIDNANRVKTENQQQADQAFRMAELQRTRAGSAVRDTQPAARPEGANQQPVVLDEGFPVQILDRKTQNINGREVEMATVHRYDPRTGKLDPEAVPYDVPVRQLKQSNYAKEPRQAQDFETRAAGPTTPELPRTADQRVTREPNQTYRTTPEDNNAEFPGATRPGPEDGQGPQGRSPLPKQPEGPGPFRERPTTEEQVLRDFEERQRRRQNQRAEDDLGEEDFSDSEQEAARRNSRQEAEQQFRAEQAQQQAEAERRAQEAQRQAEEQQQRDRAKAEADKQKADAEAARAQSEAERRARQAKADKDFEDAMERHRQASEKMRQQSEKMREEARKSADEFNKRWDDLRAKWAREDAERKDRWDRERAERQQRYKEQRENWRQQRQNASGAKQNARGRDYQSTDDNVSTVAKKPGTDGRFEIDARKYVVSDKGGPIRFSDQKQGAKWIINEGHKKSPDQIFELENHPSGKGFTVRERGRSEPKPEPEPPPSSDGPSTGPGNSAAGAKAGGERVSPGAPPPPKRLGAVAERDFAEQQRHIDDIAERENVDGWQREPDRETEAGQEQPSRPESRAGEEDITGQQSEPSGRDNQAGGSEQPGRGSTEGAGRGPDEGKPDVEDQTFPDGKQAKAASNLRNKFYSNPLADPEAWRELGRTLADTFGWAKDEADAWTHEMRHSAMALGKASHKGVLQWLRDGAETLGYTNDGKLRTMAARYKSDTLREIADKFFAQPGLHGRAIGEDYFQALNTRKGEFLNPLKEAFAPFKDMDLEKQHEAMKQIGRLVQNPGAIRKGTPIHDAAATIAKILKDAHTYLRKAGVDVGEVKNGYLPRVENVDAILKDPEGFLKAAKRAYQADGIPQKEAQAAAENWLNRVRLGDWGVHHEGSEFANSAGSTRTVFTKSRTLSKKADEIMGDFFLRNPADVLPAYINRAVQKAEWSRRFGVRDPGTPVPKGEDKAEWLSDQDGKWKDLKARLIAEGNGNLIPDTVAIIRSITGNMVPSWGATGAAKGALSLARTWSALAYLPRSMFASLSEPVNIAIRTGNTMDVARAYGETLRQMIPGVKKTAGAQYLHNLTHDLGVIGEAVDDLTMLQRIGGEQGGLLARKIQTKFFRANGLTQLTEANRIASVKIGMMFMRRLAKDVSEKTAYEGIARKLISELGVSADKVDGFVRYVAQQDKPTVATLKTDGEHGDAYRMALGRFVGQTVMHPTGALKPYYAQHPTGAMIYNLQSFNFAMQKNVLNRMASMAKDVVNPKSGLNLQERGYALMPLVNIAPLLAVTYGVSELRDALFKDPARAGRPAPTTSDTAKRVVSRAGLTGSWDLLFNAFTGARYQHDPLTAALGPILGGADSEIGAALDTLSDRNSPNTNTQERKLASTTYSMAVQPVLTAALLATTPEGRIAGKIAGTVGLYTLSHPGTRETFTRALAGPPLPPN